MKNYASRKTVKKGGVRFRTPSTYLARKVEDVKRFNSNKPKGREKPPKQYGQ